MKIPVTQIDLIPSADVEAGEVFCGSLDSPLSTEGMKGLKKVVRRKSGWDTVVTSPMQRCSRFAEWLANKHETPLQENKAFREMDFGEWEGNFPHIIMQEDPAMLAQWWTDPAEVNPPSGESFKQFRQRVLKGWQGLLKQYRGKHIVLVTHPGVLRVVLSDVMDLPSARFFSIHIEHGTLSSVRITHDEGGDWSSLLTHGCAG